LSKFNENHDIIDYDKPEKKTIAAPSLEDLAYSRLLPYVKLQYPKYEIAKHHRVIAHYLQKVESGEVTRLAIFQPPRSGKTMLAGNFFASWYLGRNPEKEIIYASYGQDRSDDVGRDIRNLMSSDVHEKVFPGGCLASDAKAARKFATTKGGKFYGVGWGGSLTGRGADCSLHGTLIETEDGPIKIEDLHLNPLPPRVLSVNHLGQSCYSPISKSIKIEGKEIYELRTKHGKRLRATADHRVYSITRGFVRFVDLRIGEELVCLKSYKKSRQKYSQLNGGKDQQIYKREVSNKFKNPSYKYEPDEQYSREFGDALCSLPFSSTSFATDTVSMAPRICGDKDTVYDLRVEKTHNYFANEILAHNCIILDDLVKDRVDAQSDINRRKREEWFTSSCYTRLMPGQSAIILIMTRWDYRDIASFLLRDLAHEKWTVIKCPAIAEENDLLKRKPGEALWPERFPLERMERTRKTLTSEDWNALYQQNPVPKEGGLIQMDWFKLCRFNIALVSDYKNLLINNKDIPESMKFFKRITISIDTAYKVSQINDPTAITIWGSSSNNHYLINSITKRVEFPDLVELVKSIHKEYTDWGLGAVPVLIEDKASGQSLIQQLKRTTRIPIIAISPTDSKVVRMEDSTVYMKAGNVWLPERASWLASLELEFAQFPMGLHDDQCDSASQYINWAYKKHYKRSSTRGYRR